MSEIVTTYMLDNPSVAIPMDRDEFYAEQIKISKETKQPTRAVEIVDIFIFDERGEVFLQKRADQKMHNPGFMDKTIGGHLQYNDSEDYTVMVETVQELQVPSIVLRTEEDFRKTLLLLKEYLNTIALLKHIDTRIYCLEKVIDGEKVVIANKVHLFFGVYRGAVKTVDREAKGVLLYSLDELDKEMQQAPDRFTHDMHVFMWDYRSRMEHFIREDLKISLGN